MTVSDEAFSQLSNAVTANKAAIDQLKSDLAAGNVTTATISDEQKLRTDYAWKWFAYHADQRVKMFNYMLLAVGIFANAAVSAVNYGLPDAAFAICILAAVLSGIFGLLDKRNRDLVIYGEDVIREVERDTLFVSKLVFKPNENDATFGVLLRQADDDKKRLNAGKLRSKLWTPLSGRHRFWLPFIALLLAAAFVGSAVYVSCHWDTIAERGPGAASRFISGGGGSHFRKVF